MSPAEDLARGALRRGRLSLGRTAIVSCLGGGVVLAVSAAAPVPAAPPWLRSPQGSEVRLASPEEPGGRFVMEGSVLGARDSVPLAGVTLYVYHVDAKGFYAPESDPHSYPRLAGVLRTDSLGRYRVRSILPGQYEGPPHVHFEAWGPNRPARSWSVNLYMGPEEKPDSSWGHMVVVRRHVLDANLPETFVTRDASGIFHARYDLHWDRALRMPAHLDSVRRGLGDR